MSLLSLYRDPNPLGFGFGARLPSATENEQLRGLRQYKRAIQGMVANNFGVPSIATASSKPVLAVAYDAKLGLYIATYETASGVPALKSSVGAQLWASRSLPVSSNFTPGIAASSGAGLFVIGAGIPGAATATKYLTSPDGITWTARSSATSSVDQIRALTWAPSASKFISGFGLGKIETSPDGVTWTSQTSPIAASAGNGWVDSAVSESLIVMMGPQDGTYATSQDGVTWTLRHFPNNDHVLQVVYSADLQLWIAIGLNGSTNELYTSPDAITWTLGTMPADATDVITGLVELCGALVLAYWNSSLSSIQNMAVSFDGGATWTSSLHLSSSTSNIATYLCDRRIALTLDDTVILGIGI